MGRSRNEYSIDAADPGHTVHGPEEDRRRLLGSLGAYLEPPLVANDPVLNAREVALLFRVSAATVRRWAGTGKLEAFRSPGGHWIFPLPGVWLALQPHRAAGSVVSES